MVFEIQISIGEKGSVRWVIVHLVEVDELLVLQISDELGFTATVEFVLTLGEEVLADLVHECAVWIRHGTFHLVVDDSSKFEST